MLGQGVGVSAADPEFPLLLVQGVGVRAAVSSPYLEFPMYRQQKVGAPFKPFFGLSGIHGPRPGVVEVPPLVRAT
jgi:hypothetical protein